MPDSIKSYDEGHESFLVSNFENRGQSSDFIQEEANKTTKSFLSPEMTSPEIWKSLSKSYDVKRAKRISL